MRIDIITLFPEFFNSFFKHSILDRAQQKGLVELYYHNLRDYSRNKQKSVDDYQYGGDAGMVLTIQPIDDCISMLKKERKYDEIIYLTPQGETLNQETCNWLSLKSNIILLCGHYKGIDQRVRDNLITKEISIGDYVLTGGEIAAGVIADSIIRLIPGVISNETSALSDSFQDNLLSHPIYTRPENYKGWRVPKILTSGNKKMIENWKEEQIIRITKNKRPDLFDKKAKN